MVKRLTTHVLKNSTVSNKILPTNLFNGEAVVNTADGVMYFSGFSGTNTWVPSGTDTNKIKFFEVGSNLYDLKLRNKITHYKGLNNLSGKFLSGTTNGFELADISAIAGIDTFTTGLTYTSNNNRITLKQNQGRPDLSVVLNEFSGLTINGDVTANNFIGNLSGTSIYATSATTSLNSTFSQIANNAIVSGVYSGGSIILSNLTGGTVNITGITSTDTFVTGFTYNPSNNTISLFQNQGVGVKNVEINNFSGLTVGTGGLVVQGSLTVYGPSVSAFTSQLYVQDNNIQLNYNPTGSTVSSSIGAGFTIQDGTGVAGSDVNFDIRPLKNMAGIVVGENPNTAEYSSLVGYMNRGWVTQLNDIVMRSNNLSTPNGVRVLAEFDVLDGGQY